MKSGFSEVFKIAEKILTVLWVKDLSPEIVLYNMPAGKTSKDKTKLEILYAQAQRCIIKKP